MFQIANSTPLQAALSLFTDARGANIVAVAVKGAFDMVGEGAMRVSATPVPINLQDVHYGDPASSSVKYPCDLVMGKLATDVGLVGSAYSPEGRPVRELSASIRVGALHSEVLVIGDRVFDDGGLSRPAPFSQLELTYERAFGGASENGEFSEFNPVGCGFASTKSELQGRPGPNVEDPRQRFDKWDGRPPVAGFGFIAPAWRPRRDFSGTYDAAWLEGQFPLPPEDFDVRFFNCAARGLRADGFLQGGELVELTNLSPRGYERFHLPAISVWLDFHLGGRIVHRRAEMWSVILEPGLGRFCVVWGASIVVGAQPSRLSEIAVTSTWLDASRPQRAA